MCNDQQDNSFSEDEGFLDDPSQAKIDGDGFFDSELRNDSRRRRNTMSNNEKRTAAMTIVK